MGEHLGTIDKTLPNIKDAGMTIGAIRETATRLLEEERHSDLLIYLRQVQDSPGGEMDISLVVLSHIVRDAMDRLSCVQPLSETRGPLSPRIYESSKWLAGKDAKAYMKVLGFSKSLATFVYKMARYVMVSGRVIEGGFDEVAGERITELEKRVKKYKNSRDWYKRELHRLRDEAKGE